MYTKILKFNRKNFVLYLLIFLVIIGFFFRTKGLNQNISFWSDEAVTLIYSRSILFRGSPRLLTGNLEDRGISFYYLTALFLKFFGFSEFSARLPAVFFGTGTIILVYFIINRIFNQKIALATSFLVTFSTLEILWSRQARWYSATQFLFLLLLWALWLFDKSLKKEKNFFSKEQIFLLVISLLFLITSSISYSLLAITIFVYLIFNFKRFFYLKKCPKIYLLMTMLIWVFVFIYFLLSSKTNQVTFFGLQFKKLNNYLFYYRIYLTRFYLIFCLLALFGFLVNYKNRIFQFLVCILFLYLLYLSFFTAYHYIRYLLPIFPIIFFLAVNGIEGISKLIPIKQKNIVFIFLLLVIVLASGRFTFFPKSFYSLNDEFRETPEPDYKGIYQKVKALKARYQDIIVIDVLPELGEWYLGEGSVSYSLKSEKVVNWYKGQGWVIDPYCGGQFISNKKQMEKVIKENKRGVVVLEYTEASLLPRDLVDFIEKNLNLIVKYDSLLHNGDPKGWPILLAGWGLNNHN